MGEENIVMEKIKNNFIDNVVSFVYEDVCRQKMWRLNIENKLGIEVNKIGRWWNGEDEIDIVGINTMGNDIIFGECKYYSNKLMDEDVFYNLIKKAQKVEWKKNERNEKYILFSITGYSDKLKNIAKERKELILG